MTKPNQGQDCLQLLRQIASLVTGNSVDSLSGQDVLQLLREIVASTFGTSPSNYLGRDETQLYQLWNEALYA